MGGITMNQRITCIAIFNKESNLKINNVLRNIGKSFNKVPCHIENRDQVDTLPYHTTFCVWNSNLKEKIVPIFNNLAISKIEMKVTDIKIKAGYQNNSDSYNLYFALEVNSEFQNIQKKIYNSLPNEQYKPDDYLIHMSIHSSKNYEELVEIQKDIKKVFRPFMIESDEIALFEIYPAELISKRKVSK